MTTIRGGQVDKPSGTKIMSDPQATLMVDSNLMSCGLLAHPTLGELMWFYLTPRFRILAAGSTPETMQWV